MKQLVTILLLFVSVTALFAQKPDSLVSAGYEALRAKDYAKALQNYEKALAVWGNLPQDSAMIFNCGACALGVKDYAKADKYFDMAIAKNYKVETCYQYKASMKKVQKDDKGYVAVLKEGMAKVPATTVLKDMLAKHYQSLGLTRYNEAAKLVQKTAETVKAGKMKSSDAACKAEMGKAKKLFEEAIKNLNLSLEINAANDDAKKVKSACEENIKSLVI